MNKPLFSIVIPSLNHGAYIERALRSVIDQAANDTEIILIDGGSTDGSVEIIEKFSSMLDGERFEKILKNTNIEHSTLNIEHRTINFRTRFLWCSEKDNGQSAALNKGFARASGEYLFWLNADDLLLPGTLAQVREYLRVHPACRWLAGNLVYIDEQDRVLWCACDGEWHDALYRHAPVRVYGPSSVFSKRLFDEVGGFDETLHYVMDTDLWLRFKKAGARFSRLPYYFWGFRIHAGSKTASDLMGRTTPEMADEQERMYLKNGLKVTQLGLCSQRIWRILNGCYAKAWWDSRRRRSSLVR
jgi:glycosyltransferase involved in cell wall biosynthesis